MSIVPSPLTQTAELTDMATKLNVIARHVQDGFPQLVKTVRSELPASLARSGAPRLNADAVAAEMVFQLNKISAAMQLVERGATDLISSIEEAIQIRVSAENNRYASK